MLVSVSELLLNTNNSSVVSDNAVKHYYLISLLENLLKSLVNLSQSLETLISLRSTNILFFLLLKTKYDFQLELYNEHAFKILNINAFLSHTEECKDLLIKCGNETEAFMKL